PHERGGEEETMAMSGNDELTPREREVLELLLQRWHDSEIAEQLVISVRTVEAHVAHLMDKFGVHSRDELRRRFEDQ
ncbi:MAG: helix-turn-helix transcriptional regulator, partial [bacterium]